MFPKKKSPHIPVLNSSDSWLPKSLPKNQTSKRPLSASKYAALPTDAERAGAFGRGERQPPPLFIIGQCALVLRDVAAGQVEEVAAEAGEKGAFGIHAERGAQAAVGVGGSQIIDRRAIG
jgi:hypothetical protein